MRQVEIPGGTATFRDADDLTGRQADLIEAAMMTIAPLFVRLPALERGEDETEEAFGRRADEAFAALGLTLAESSALLECRRAMVFATLDSWTIDRPVPKSMDEVADLPRSLVSALNAAVGGRMMQVGTDYSPDVDPESPTEGSGSSDSPSRDSQELSQIPNSPESTGTSVTGESTLA